MPVILENKAYDAQSSQEERQAIADRVSKISEDILLWKEVPVPSLLSVELMERRVQELTEGLQAYTRIVDLSEAGRPNAQVRRRLREMLAGEHRLRHIGVFTLKNALINVALRFVFSGLAKNISLSVHQTFADALQSCRDSRTV